MNCTQSASLGQPPAGTAADHRLNTNLSLPSHGCKQEELGNNSRACVGPQLPSSFAPVPGVEPFASQFPQGRTRIVVPAALSEHWSLASEAITSFQLEIDSVLKQQTPSPWTAKMAHTAYGMRTNLPAEVSAIIGDMFCRGWRRLHDGTLVLVMSTRQLARLTVKQCQVIALGSVCHLRYHGHGNKR